MLCRSKGQRTAAYSRQYSRFLCGIMWRQAVLTAKSFMSKFSVFDIFCLIFVPFSEEKGTEKDFREKPQSGFSERQFVRQYKLICIHSEPLRWVLNGGAASLYHEGMLWHAPLSPENIPPACFLNRASAPPQGHALAIARSLREQNFHP